MIPIKDTAPKRGFPFLTYFLIVVNSVIFFYMLTLDEVGLDLFIYDYSLIPALVTQGHNLYTFLTSVFLHGSLSHLFGNMLFLHIFGDNVESKLGKIRFLFLYFISFCFLPDCLYSCLFYVGLLVFIPDAVWHW